MAAFIHNLATAVPETSYSQNFLRDRMKQYLGADRLTRSLIHRIYTRSGIAKRHTVVEDFNGNGEPGFFFQEGDRIDMPSTGARNRIYAGYAKTEYVRVARQLLADHPCFGPGDVTHVITLSCTGFFAPGPDFEIVHQLGLSPATQRYHLGFMGCCAAFPALRMARSFCDAEPEAVVLVVSLELCSLHFQHSTEIDQLISASVFADGCAGALIAGREPESGCLSLRLDGFASALADKSQEDMAWTVGDTGFEMVLSTQIPEIIEAHVERAILPLLDAHRISSDVISHWAVHPGGRAILDKVETVLGKDESALQVSRLILSQYGNMSSATILFVLSHLLDQPMATGREAEWVLAMAFGPGVTIESGLFLKRKS